MLANPAQSGFFGQGLFHHRGAVDKGAITERTDLIGNAIGQLLQPPAHQLVVIAAQGITRDIALVGMIQQLFDIQRLLRQVIQAHADDTQGLGHQLFGTTAFFAMLRHPLHLAMELSGQPLLQFRFILREIRIGNRGLLKAELAAPLFDPIGQCGRFDIVRCLLVLLMAHDHNHSLMNSLPHDLYTADQCRELDRIAIEELGMSGSILMERAGDAAWRLLLERYPDVQRIGVLCGTGNNGGDGFVLARLAHADGKQVQVWQVGDSDHLGGDALAALQRLQGMEIYPEPFDESSAGEVDLLVDALLGTGVQGEINEPHAGAVDWINQQELPVLALDVPSGLDANTGRVVGRAVHATDTITFIGLKSGLLTGDAPDHVGRLAFSGLNLPAGVYEKLIPVAQRLDFTPLLRELAVRPRNSHKGLYGHVLVIGGDEGMNGAARLAGEAALRCGAGRVTIATRAAHAATLNQGRPELMCQAVEDPDDLLPLLERASVLAVGPGMGQGDWGRMLWRLLEASPLPQVVDADALNLLAQDPNHLDHRILTPHPGEAGRLLDRASAAVQGDRLQAVRDLQEKYGGVIVLKGAGTLVSTDETNSICSAGNPGMSSAGMGDVLTGVIAALLAQGLSPAVAAQLGVCLHGMAADQAVQAVGERGLLAADLFGPLRRLVNG